VDAVVSSGALGALDARARSELAAGVLRVLKPGGAFILVERGAARPAARMRRPCARARRGAAGRPRPRSLARPGSQAARRARRPLCRAHCGHSARAWVRPAPALRPPRARPRGGPTDTCAPAGLQALEALLALPGFEGATYDVALAGLDAHIVAFARKQPAGEARARGAAAEAPGRRAGRKGFAASRRD